MKLNPELKKKTRSSYPCAECKIDIEIGEMYISVMYSDGFRKRLHGAYHQACWDKCPDNPKAKKHNIL